VTFLRTDSFGAGTGEPIATASWGTRIEGYVGFHVSEGERWVLEVARERWNLSLHSLYVVTDAESAALGTIQRETATARRWRIADADGNELGTVERTSLPLGLLRSILNRVFLGFVPLPYRFAFRVDGIEIGSFRRLAQGRHRYVLDLSGDRDKKLDPRLPLAAAIELAEIEEEH
jgi:hypothetical protein